MTKEALNKHWAALEWWKDQPKGAEIWFYDIERVYGNKPEWHLTQNPTWMNSYDYVINDKFAEYRKAIVDGKQIQILNKLGDKYTWEDRKYDNPNQLELYHTFRIKPSEPLYKQGDWVIFDNGNIGIYQKWNGEDDRDYHTINIWDCNEWYKDDESYYDRFKHWEPSEGEWCWFYDNEESEPFFGKFIQMDRKQFETSSYDCTAWYDYCEPFIGTLPSILQE